jgi:hypothetical protein
VQADIVFVVDSSGSIVDKNTQDTDNWQITKDFINNIIDTFDIGDDSIRVGLVEYSWWAENAFFLNDYSDKYDLKSRVNLMENMGYFTNTSGGLKLMKDQQFSSQYGDRQNAPNVAILITDGYSTIAAQDTIAAAQDAHNRGIHIIVVGVTADVNETELAAISSSPHYKNSNYFTEANYAALNTISSTIGTQVCAAAMQMGGKVSKKNSVVKMEKEVNVDPVNLFFVVEVPDKDESWKTTNDTISKFVEDINKLSPDTKFGIVFFPPQKNVTSTKELISKDTLISSLKNVSVAVTPAKETPKTTENKDKSEDNVESTGDGAGYYESQTDTGSNIDALNNALVDFYTAIYSEKSRANHMILLGDLNNYKMDTVLKAILGEIGKFSKLYTMGIHEENNIETLFTSFTNISQEKSVEERSREDISTVHLIQKIMNIESANPYGKSTGKSAVSYGKAKFDKIANLEIDGDEPVPENLIVQAGVYCYKTSEAGLQCFCNAGACNVYPTNSTSCEDVNECNNDEVHGCSYTCVNTIGSYYCTCPSNLRLAKDNQMCSDFNECVDEPCGRGGVCINTFGSYICVDPSVVSNYEAAALLNNNGDETPAIRGSEEQIGNIMASASVSTSSTTLILACTVGSLGGAVFVLSLYMITSHIRRKRRVVQAY